jgi:hypothetical protein
MKGKLLAVDEEKKLRQMTQEHKPVEAIAKTLDKTNKCAQMKINCLKLEVVVYPKMKRTTTSDLVLLDELFFASLIRRVWDKTLPFFPYISILFYLLL